MNENDAMLLQEHLELITDVIEKKDVQIYQLKMDNDSLSAKVKKYYNDGLLEGMEKAWNVANAIVHLKWDGAYAKPKTVEDWFEMYTAQEAFDALTECQCKMVEKPKHHWILDYKENRFVCSFCKIKTKTATPYCSWCGAEMDKIDKDGEHE